VRGTLQVFYALEDRKTPDWISIVFVVINGALGTALMKSGFGVAGLSFTLSISTAVQAIVLMAFVRRRIGALGVVDVIKAGGAKLGIAVVAVGAAVFVARLGDWAAGTTMRNVVVLAASIGVAVVLYGGGAVALRVRGADVIADKVARRLRRRG
jgi:putative peptidoglycan lipid II flippase